MAARETGLPGTRQERRKAATRQKILDGAESLFSERGYAATSVEDISEAADVAVRTIYMHFPSKAAIMLAQFDGWVDSFVPEVLRRPIDEPVMETVRAALQAMTAAGWVDRVENRHGRVHPLVEHLASGSPDIAGHVLQRWMAEMARLADDAATRGNHPPGSPEPQARAVAVFAAWMAAIFAARGRGDSSHLPSNDPGSPGLDIFALITGGTL